MSDRVPFETVVFDVDGTLIDSNGAHAQSWTQALNENGLVAELESVRRMIGMGGDKLLPAVAQIPSESEAGQALTRRKKEIFNTLLPTLQPTRGARDLLEFLRAEGVTLATATSADDEELQALLAQAGLNDLFEHYTSKDDASVSKPEPDIVRAALQKAGARPEGAVMVGDTPYDCEAAAGTGVACVALRSGGHWTDADFAGAAAIFDDPLALLEAWRQGTGSNGSHT